MEHAPKITCDVCPAVKGEVNHWHRYRRRGGQITFMPWEDDLARDAEGHVCGQDCAAKILIRHLDGKNSDGSFPAPIPEPEWRCERGECGGTCAGCRPPEDEDAMEVR